MNDDKNDSGEANRIPGAQPDRTVADCHAALALDPDDVATYRRLHGLYLEQKAYDPAWCLAAALAFLRGANEEEQRFFEDYRPKGLLQVKSRLDEVGWTRDLFHPLESVSIGKIFELIAPAAHRVKVDALDATSHAPSLDPRCRQDPATSKVTFARVFGWTAQVLAIPAPQLYVRTDLPGGIAAVPSAPPASVAGVDALTRFSTHELTFLLGKHLTMYRGEHFLKTLFPTVTELTLLFYAGVRMVATEAEVPAALEKMVPAVIPSLQRHLQPAQLEGLHGAVRKLISDEVEVSIARWSRGVAFTAARAGLLLCGDLEIARKVFAEDPPQPWEPTVAEQMKQLLAFSVSEPYFALRRSLGVALGAGG